MIYDHRSDLTLILTNHNQVVYFIEQCNNFFQFAYMFTMYCILWNKLSLQLGEIPNIFQESLALFTAVVNSWSDNLLICEELVN